VAFFIYPRYSRINWRKRTRTCRWNRMGRQWIWNKYDLLSWHRFNWLRVRLNEEKPWRLLPADFFDQTSVCKLLKEIASFDSGGRISLW